MPGVGTAARKATLGSWMPASCATNFASRAILKRHARARSCLHELERSDGGLGLVTMCTASVRQGRTYQPWQVEIRTDDDHLKLIAHGQVRLQNIEQNRDRNG